MVVKAKPIYPPSEIDLSALEPSSAFIWSTRNIRLPKGAQWDFEDRAWQVAIFDDMSPGLVIIKPTQIGMTTLMLCKMFHYAFFNNVRAMYTLPRQDDVYDLVNGRIASMISGSPVIANRIKDIDNVRLKTFGDSYLHFMESTVPPRMLDVDLLINDEIDLSNQDHLEQYIARLDASLHPLHWRISTPTIHNFGVDADYKKSTQNIWLVRCPRCNHDQEMTWENNIKTQGGESWYCCGKCEKKLTPQDIQAGRWVASYPNRDISGYSVSQLMVTSIPPDRLYKDYKRMTLKNFYNLRLGKPYASSSGGFNRTELYEKCIQNTHQHESSGNGYFMGADQGNEIHVLIGKQMDRGIAIVHAEVIPMEDGFDRLAQLMQIYGIRQAVIDGLPNRHSSTSFARRFGANRVACAFYSPSAEVYKADQRNFSVLINRNMMFDKLYEKIGKSEIMMYGSRNAITEVGRKFVGHLSSIKRDEVTSETKLGGQKTEIAWINTGQDHFAHTLLYLAVAIDMKTAANGFRITEVSSVLNGDKGITDEIGVANIYKRQRPNLVDIRKRTSSLRGLAR